MPLYEFQCADCGEEFEELVRSSSETVTCPKCQSQQVSRKLSLFSSGGNAASGSSCSAPSGSGFR